MILGSVIYFSATAKFPSEKFRCCGLLAPRLWRDHARSQSDAAEKYITEPDLAND